jgi:hypothetical protein
MHVSRLLQFSIFPNQIDLTCIVSQDKSAKFFFGGGQCKFSPPDTRPGGWVVCHHHSRVEAAFGVSNPLISTWMGPCSRAHHKPPSSYRTVKVKFGVEGRPTGLFIPEF